MTAIPAATKEEKPEAVIVQTELLELLYGLYVASSGLRYACWINTDLKDYGVPKEEMQKFQRAFHAAENWIHKRQSEIALSGEGGAG